MSDRSTHAHGYAEEDDLVARSYIKLIIHKDQVKYVSKTQTKYDTWQALKDILEGASTTYLLTLMTEINNPRWTSDLEAAGDLIPECAYATKLLVLMPEQFHNTVLHINRNHSTQPKYKTRAASRPRTPILPSGAGQAHRTNDVAFQANRRKHVLLLHEARSLLYVDVAA
ncbi:hypothetical protein DYB37_010294 [Aphanomyces astaci]|uniref:Uncharacterized protein n=1 Tax=Aphanomyces astaci TaxID=112090 RepID=A0A3R7EG08_APHAT|nr:hypothetical protein DYB35_011101 [Aphanomyces astaci]RHZ12000.1 hypothetical protein DYB37_010294 [Aphanomyces astaci]